MSDTPPVSDTALIIQSAESAGASAVELKRLTGLLHSRCAHPDYEYDTKESGRKSGAEVYPPEGHGWEINTDKGRDGWERFDYTEETYFRRLKSDADNDEPDLWTLKNIVLPKLEPKTYREMVKWALGLIPDPFYAGIGPQPRRKHAMHYVHREGIENPPKGSGYYSDESATPGHPYFIYESPTLQIRTQLLGDLESFVRMKKRNGQWGLWQLWRDFDLPIDSFDVAIKLNNLQVAKEDGHE